MPDIPPPVATSLGRGGGRGAGSVSLSSVSLPSVLPRGSGYDLEMTGWIKSLRLDAYGAPVQDVARRYGRIWQLVAHESASVGRSQNCRYRRQARTGDSFLAPQFLSAAAAEMSDL